ncbi:MAG TPA: LysR substrate-binding domain-containing protein [Opitutaceae bacterium]
MSAFEDLALLRAFVAIVECGSISAGARRLRMSQPGLSRQLRTLEENCGVALLRRDTHQMSVTEAGRRLLEDAKSILAQADEADRRLREGHTTLSGQLRLFATVDLGQFIVTRLVSQFLHEHPKITAALALTNRPLHMIQEGCDVGILPGRITDESVIARPAGTVALQLAASPLLSRSRPAPKEPADLLSWPWVSLEGSQFWSARELTLHREGAEKILRVSPVLLAEGVTSVREAVRTGLGIAVLPNWLIEDDLRSGALVPVLPRWKPKDLSVHVVYAGQRVLPARVVAFIDFAIRYLTSEGMDRPYQGGNQARMVR